MCSFSTNLNSLSAKGNVTEQVRFLLVRRGYSPATVAKYLSVIARFQLWMESKGNKVENVSRESVRDYLTNTHCTTQTKRGRFLLMACLKMSSKKRRSIRAWVAFSASSSIRAGSILSNADRRTRSVPGTKGWFHSTIQSA